MRKRNDLWDKPWVSIATVVGIVAVLIIALVFFMSGGNNGGQSIAVPSSPSQTIPVPTGSSGQSPAPSGTGIKPESVKELPTVTVPGKGAFVRVSYLGGYVGTYGINGEMVTVRDSGERVYPLTATGAVSATFHKEDSSARHEILVEIYKDGRALKFARNSSAYGEVSVSTQV